MTHTLRTALVSALLGLALITPAQAVKRKAPQPTMTNARRCEAYGRMGAMAAEARSRGVPSWAVLEVVRGELAASTRTPGMTRQGIERTENHITEVILTVYALQPMTPDVANMAVYSACMELWAR